MQRVTIDHTEIQEWTKEHKGKPAIIDDPDAPGDTIGIRINFPGEGDEALLSNTRDISWEEFFRIFEEQNLAFSFDPEQEDEEDPTRLYHFEKRG